MKKILFLAAMLISSSTAFSQTADKIFEDINANNDVKYMELTRDILDILISQNPSEAPEALKGIESLKVMAIKDEDVVGEMRMMLPSLKKNGYEVMLDESENGTKATVYSLQKGKTIKEMLIIVQEPDECQLMLFKGDIDPDKIEELMSFGDED